MMVLCASRYGIVDFAAFMCWLSIAEAFHRQLTFRRHSFSCSYDCPSTQRSGSTTNRAVTLLARGGSEEDEFSKYLGMLVDAIPEDVESFTNGSGTENRDSVESKQDVVEKGLEALMSFDLKPKEVVEYLDRFVIQQSDAKQVLAVSICDHYNHCRRFLQKEEEKRQRESNSQDDFELERLLETLGHDSPSSPPSNVFEYAKPNVLLAGPTGVGKTYLLKCLARLVGVPFVKADATKFSETGIVGRDAEDLVRDLVDKAQGNTTLASMGIIYLDEIDKIAAGSGDDKAITRGSFNTRGVQNNFLKLLEDTEVSLERQTDMVISNLPSFMGGGAEGQKPKTISTKNILFIFSGAFTGLDKDLKRKREKKAFGLDITQSTAPQPNTVDNDHVKPRSYLRYAETADFVRAGLEPEFVGRVPVRVALDALDASDLKQILVGAEGSVWKQFIRDMDGYNIKMTATDEALDEIAKLAEKEATGARGLVTVLERALRQHKYELPSTSIEEFVLDRATVLNPELELHRLLAKQTTDDDMAVLLRDLKRWEFKVNRKNPPPVQIRLNDDAINYLVLKALERGESSYSFASRHFGEALEAVVRRINEATSQTYFPISLDMAKDPKKELRSWLDVLKGKLQDDSDHGVKDGKMTDRKKKRRD